MECHKVFDHCSDGSIGKSLLTPYNSGWKRCLKLFVLVTVGYLQKKTCARHVFFWGVSDLKKNGNLMEEPWIGKPWEGLGMKKTVPPLMEL